jgi:hypothetical protein
MDFIADDYLAVALDPEPRVYRLYSTAKLDPRSLVLYPELAACCRKVHQPGFDKVVLFLEDGFQEQLKESLSLQLALKPWISGVPETSLGEVEPLEIERSLACETLQLPHAGAGTVKFLNRVSREVPRSAIYLGTKRTQIATVIQQALASHSQTTGDLPRRCSSAWRPFITLMVHFDQNDCGELKALVTEIEAQGYPRTEFIVVASGPGSAMMDEVSQDFGAVRFFGCPEPIVNAVAWNRGIRESFAELILFVEPGDRLAVGALDALVRASEMAPAAAWIGGKASGDKSESFESLRGALIRKSAFQKGGLFPADPIFQGREHRIWLRRVEAMGLTGRPVENVTLRAAGAELVHGRNSF